MMGTGHLFSVDTTTALGHRSLRRGGNTPCCWIPQG